MSNELITNSPYRVDETTPAAPAQGRKTPPGRTGRRSVLLVLAQVLVGMVIAGAFVGLYIGTQRQPAPHALPIAVVGTQQAASFRSAFGDSSDVRTASDANAARRLVRTHEAVAAVVPAKSGISVYVAGADGKSAVGTATAMIAEVALRGHVDIVSTTDIVPLSKYDSQGLSSFYLVFGATLASFIVAQVVSSMAQRSKVRTRIAITLGSVIASITVAAVVAGPIYGSVLASTGLAIVVLALLGVGVSFSTMGIARLVGPIGNVLSTLLFTTLGNAISGATISSFLLPPFLSHLGEAFPQGAAFRAIIDFGYYGGRGALGPILVLVAWIVGASALVWLTTRTRRSAG